MTSSATWIEFGVGVLDALVAKRQGEPGPNVLELRERFAARSTDDAFAVIAANAGLLPDDVEVFAVLAVAELEPSQHLRVAALQGDAAKNRLTLGSLVELFADVAGHRGALTVGADAPLRRAEFVTVIADGPWADHGVSVHPSVAWALTGDLSVDPALPVVRSVITSAHSSGDSFVVVSGPDRQRRVTMAIECTAGSRFMVVETPTDDAGWTALVREATLTGMGIIVEVLDRLPPFGARCIERSSHLSWALSSRIDFPLDELPARRWTAHVANDDPPSDSEWAAAFGAETERTHPLKPEQLQPVSRAFHAHGGDLDAAVRRLVSGRLDALARRIRPTRRWDDLVLSADRKAALRSIVDRYRHADQVFDDWGFGDGAASRGTVALFSGPSGTGKTLAAEVIAAELGLDVFKLDLSSVVSKYIGETEKNLEQVFDAASAGNLVLFFDEADALFGKRSEVKDARDRYANIEVSYLLQRLEAYDGLVVMATNFEKNVDEAFLRRIHTRIEFALPGSAERELIWRRNLPPNAPVGDIDVQWISAQFEISGGLIRNAAVHAAFNAAATDGTITTEGAVLGVALELRKLGRLIKPGEFGRFFDLVTATPVDDE